MTKLKKDNVKKIFIIGGRSIYKLFFNSANFLHITKINLLKEGINEFFPINFKEIKNNFNLIVENKISPDATYTFWGNK